MRYGYATYEHAETWNTIGGDTREEAVLDAFTEAGEDYDTVYVCEQKPVDKLTPLLQAGDVDGLLERAEEWASEENGHGTWYEDNIYDHSEEAKAELDALLRVAFESWLEKRPGAGVWEAVNKTKHLRSELPESDAAVDPVSRVTTG